MNPKRKTQTSNLPFVFVDMAMTADGKIATANRVVFTCGSKADYERLLELRAEADAVLAGARTVDRGKVLLGPGGKKYRLLRKRRGLSEYNLRVIVSGRGTIDPDAAIFKKKFSPVIVLTTARASASRLKRLRAVATDVKICGKEEIDFRAAFQWLREKWKIRRLMGEGGGELNDVLFREGLIDELHLTICPKIFGGRDAPTISDGKGVSRLAEATKLSLKSMKRIGDEMFLIYKVRQ